MLEGSIRHLYKQISTKWVEAEWRFCVALQTLRDLTRETGEWVCPVLPVPPIGYLEKLVSLTEQNILIKTLVWNLTRVFNRDSTSFLSSFKSALFFFPWCYIKISSIYKIIQSSDFLIFPGWELWLAFLQLLH